MTLTMTDTQRRILLNLLRKSIAAGTRMPPLSKELQTIINQLDTPFSEDQKSYTFAINKTVAKEINSRLYTQLGFLMEVPEQQPEHPQVDAQRLIYTAIDEQVQGYELFGYVRKQKPTAPKKDPKPESNNAIICIASEVDGDIAGYYVLTDSILEAMDASKEDTFGYLSNPENNPPPLHNSLIEALEDIKARNLVLTGDFGCCVY